MFRDTELSMVGVPDPWPAWRWLGLTIAALELAQLGGTRPAPRLSASRLSPREEDAPVRPKTTRAERDAHAETTIAPAAGRRVLVGDRACQPVGGWRVNGGNEGWVGTRPLSGARGGDRFALALISLRLMRLTRRRSAPASPMREDRCVSVLIVRVSAFQRKRRLQPRRRRSSAVSPIPADRASASSPTRSCGARW
jgi:hypothetical protein